MMAARCTCQKRLPARHLHSHDENIHTHGTARHDCISAEGRLWQITKPIFDQFGRYKQGDIHMNIRSLFAIQIIAASFIKQ